ncbi:MAG: 30S ribosomal protein S8 [Candidatus Sungbacteria bacterium]|uniref:Small ribosomal subunit protein uS8 n=1 Tax=Candidatus Sungiibacteriota bacterium TaxID=2750080 RepID=A0A931YD24_9BACT|nr:30S ribosomal protein S8 [Candidatus Sungbacteria bacterium]
MTDPISDMLIRIKNAQAVKKETVTVPYSKVKQELARVLKESGFIFDFEKKGRSIANKKLELKLKYRDSFPAIANTKRISKPGQRIYLKYSEIFPKESGFLRIISTSKGLMSDGQARRQKLGGEILCEIL